MVVEKFVPSLESLSSLGLEGRNLGRPGNFAGMSRTLGVFKQFVQKKFCAFFRSLQIAVKGLLDLWPLDLHLGRPRNTD